MLIKQQRLWNIGIRTAHIIVTGALFGGHVFNVPPQRLLIWLGLSLVTGAVLIVLEAYPQSSWFHEARGVMVLTKLALISSIPWCWDYRAPILGVVLVLASVGSHMPRKLRHYSLFYGRVMD